MAGTALDEVVDALITSTRPNCWPPRAWPERRRDGRYQPGPVAPGRPAPGHGPAERGRHRGGRGRRALPDAGPSRPRDPRPPARRRPKPRRGRGETPRRRPGAAAHRRAVARILGAWEFWGLPFQLAPETLVPRPDTEILVETALASVPDRTAPLRCLDLGTGSGCILVALLSELRNAFGIGLDRSPGALRAAHHNAVANGVGSRAAFVAGDWCDALRGGFDLVVSNPPYIAQDLIAHLDRDVRQHDPRAALDGGPDGSTPTGVSWRACVRARCWHRVGRFCSRSATTRPTPSAPTRAGRLRRSRSHPGPRGP